MNAKLLVLAILSVATAVPAAAQSGPDDLHCFLLSNFFAKSDKQANLRAIAAQSAMFYLGKIDGRVSAQAFGAAARSIDGKTAGPQMTACVQRVGRAEQALQQSLKTAGPKK